MKVNNIKKRESEMKKNNEKEKRKNCAFMIEPSLLKKVDFYSKKIGISRSLLIRNMIDASIDDLKIYDKTGALKSINFFRTLKQNRKNELSSNEC